MLIAILLVIADYGVLVDLKFFAARGSILSRRYLWQSRAYFPVAAERWNGVAPIQCITPTYMRSRASATRQSCETVKSRRALFGQETAISPQSFDLPRHYGFARCGF